MWASFQAPADADIELSIQSLKVQSDFREKTAVVWLNFFDADHLPLAVPGQLSSGKFGYFRYVDAARPAINLVTFTTPPRTAFVRAGVSSWNKSAVTISSKIGIRLLNEKYLNLETTEDASVPTDSIYKLAPSLGQDSYLPLTSKPRWVTVPVENNDLRFGLNIEGTHDSWRLKSALVRIEFLSADGAIIPGEAPIKRSDRVGDYIYVDATEPKTYKYELTTPQGCVKVRLGFQTWAAKPLTIRLRNRLSISHRAKRSNVSKPKSNASKVSTSRARKVAKSQPKRAHELKVALICDEFTYNSFKYEFRPIILEPKTWLETFENEKPDLFFCESAWSGVDSETRPWKGQIYSSINFDKENRTELLKILEYCKDKGIPTVFWNKEDPSHFDDKVHNFVDTASKFDFAFTTDADCVERYKSEHNFKNVSALSFATQPRLFNPISDGVRSSDVIFAGSWYANHVERSADMEAIFDSILDSGLNLEIFDRYFGTTDEHHLFPERFTKYTKPAISHTELARVYKSSVFGLNINTVTESTTMFARRVFELMSSNTLVISNYAEGIEKFFGDNVITVRDDSSVLSELKDQDVERIRDENLHHVLSEHTYTKRFKQILDEIGFVYEPEDDQIALVSLVSTEDEIRSLITRFRYYSDVASKLVLVLVDDVPDSEVRHFYTKYNKLGTLVVSRSLWRKQTVRPESVLGTSNFALVSLHDFPDKEVLRKASLHLSYVDGPIIHGATKKYQFETRAAVANIVAPNWYLGTAILNAGTEIRGSFYLV
nr:glycosyltransferase [Neomicrococcus lactis]